MPKSDATTDLREYATVAQRITLFYERFPEGRINTELFSRTDGEIVFRALVFRGATEPHPAATGWASERIGDGDVNTVACLENTETSAVGRALANLGFTASPRRPSREEMEKAERARRQQAHLPAPSAMRPASPVLQARADAAHDALHLIATASRRGFPARRAEILRAHVGAGEGLTSARLGRLERRIRRWLRHHPALPDLSHPGVQ